MSHTRGPNSLPGREDMAEKPGRKAVFFPQLLLKIRFRYEGMISMLVYRHDYINYMLVNIFVLMF